jgi:hypothetical protein
MTLLHTTSSSSKATPPIRQPVQLKPGATEPCRGPQSRSCGRSRGRDVGGGVRRPVGVGAAAHFARPARPLAGQVRQGLRRRRCCWRSPGTSRRQCLLPVCCRSRRTRGTCDDVAALGTRLRGPAGVGFRFVAGRYCLWHGRRLLSRRDWDGRPSQGLHYVTLRYPTPSSSSSCTAWPSPSYPSCPRRTGLSWGTSSGPW